MISEQTLQTMTRTIHALPEFHGCIVGFHGNGQSRVLHAGLSPSINYGRIAVIIEEVLVTDPLVNADTQRWADAPGASPNGTGNPTVVTNRSVWGREAIGAGLACGMTVVAAVGVAGGVAAEVPSGGLSTFLVVASWAGMVTAGIQCANGIIRVGEIIADPDGNTLQRLDSNVVYSSFILIVDAVGVVAGVAALPSATKNLWAIIVRQRGLAQRGLTEASLAAMNRAQRTQVISELVEQASRTPEGRLAIVAAAREAQVGAATLQRAGSLSVRNASRMVKIISDETARRLHSSLLGVISTPVGVGFSAMPSTMIGSASGSVNWLINIVDTGVGTSI